MSQRVVSGSRFFDSFLVVKGDILGGRQISDDVLYCICGGFILCELLRLSDGVLVQSELDLVGKGNHILLVVGQLVECSSCRLNRVLILKGNVVRVGQSLDQLLNGGSGGAVSLDLSDRFLSVDQLLYGLVVDLRLLRVGQSLICRSGLLNSGLVEIVDILGQFVDQRLNGLNVNKTCICVISVVERLNDVFVDQRLLLLGQSIVGSLRGEDRARVVKGHVLGGGELLDHSRNGLGGVDIVLSLLERSLYSVELRFVYEGDVFLLCIGQRVECGGGFLDGVLIVNGNVGGIGQGSDHILNRVAGCLVLEGGELRLCGCEIQSVSQSDQLLLIGGQRVVCGGGFLDRFLILQGDGLGQSVDQLLNRSGGSLIYDRLERAPDSVELDPVSQVDQQLLIGGKRFECGCGFFDGILVVQSYIGRRGQRADHIFHFLSGGFIGGSLQRDAESGDIRLELIFISGGEESHLPLGQIAVSDESGFDRVLVVNGHASGIRQSLDHLGDLGGGSLVLGNAESEQAQGELGLCFKGNQLELILRQRHVIVLHAVDGVLIGNGHSVGIGERVDLRGHDSGDRCVHLRDVFVTDKRLGSVGGFIILFLQAVNGSLVRKGDVLGETLDRTDDVSSRVRRGFVLTLVLL